VERRESPPTGERVVYSAEEVEPLLDCPAVAVERHPTVVAVVRRLVLLLPGVEPLLDRPAVAVERERRWIPQEKELRMSRL
jgi:hypothetical protein